MEVVYKGGRKGNIYRHHFRCEYNGEDDEMIGPIVSVLEGASHTVQVVGDFDGAYVVFMGSNTQEPEKYVELFSSEGSEMEISDNRMEMVVGIVSHLRPVVKNVGENTSLDIVIISRIA
ncbi:MAG: hypothetical protein ACXABY_05335 [Candidatus Thorarchaeota archaeon]|jgi:hypothetical protein